MSLTDRTAPTPKEFLDYRVRFSNWDRWGDHDEHGTLNFITPATVAAAAGLVTAGRSISLSRPLATREVLSGSRNPSPMQHTVSSDELGCSDSIDLAYHGFANTHIDALCHIFTVDGRMYGGRPASEVTARGAGHNSVDRWKAGICTRGVLYDVPRHRHTDHVTFRDPVHGWELADIARARGIEPRPGDAVVVRAGAEAFWETNPNFGPPWEAPGIHASVLEFLWETEAALLVWDLMEAPGQGYDAPALPIHSLALPYMGLPLLDNANLEELAEACIDLDRSEFFLVVAPLVLTGGTGSPVNPLALF